MAACLPCRPEPGQPKATKAHGRTGQRPVFGLRQRDGKLPARRTETTQMAAWEEALGGKLITASALVAGAFVLRRVAPLLGPGFGSLARVRPAAVRRSRVRDAGRDYRQAGGTGGRTTAQRRSPLGPQPPRTTARRKRHARSCTSSSARRGRTPTAAGTSATSEPATDIMSGNSSRSWRTHRAIFRLRNARIWRRPAQRSAKTGECHHDVNSPCWRYRAHNLSIPGLLEGENDGALG